MTDIDVAGLLQLFDAELAEVKFPEVDREVLARATSSLAAAEAAVAEADARAAASRAEALARREELGRVAARAVAYARVYAEGSPAVAAKLDALVSPPRALAPKRRGRPRKVPVEQVAIDAAE
ncbi:MAG: hypothetical protein IT374_01880 [Polyangiaceae bacterium]|nr:hypothetical protein [Polyangiaceae bacterium]